MFFDFLIHQRLRRIRLVCFVVTVTTVTNQVNHHITFKGVAIINGELRHKYHGFRIITVDVENWRLHHLGDVSTVFSGTGIFRIGGGKTNLVVNHQAYRTANFKGAGLRNVKGFCHHTLTGKGRVTVNSNWQR